MKRLVHTVIRGYRPPHGFRYFDPEIPVGKYCFQFIRKVNSHLSTTGKNKNFEYYYTTSKGLDHYYEVRRLLDQFDNSDGEIDVVALELSPNGDTLSKVRSQLEMMAIPVDIVGLIAEHCDLQTVVNLRTASRHYSKVTLPTFIRLAQENIIYNRLTSFRRNRDDHEDCHRYDQDSDEIYFIVPRFVYGVPDVNDKGRLNKLYHKSNDEWCRLEASLDRRLTRGESEFIVDNWIRFVDSQIFLPEHVINLIIENIREECLIEVLVECKFPNLAVVKALYDGGYTAEFETTFVATGKFETIVRLNPLTRERKRQNPDYIINYWKDIIRLYDFHPEIFKQDLAEVLATDVFIQPYYTLHSLDDDLLMIFLKHITPSKLSHLINYYNLKSSNEQKDIITDYIIENVNKWYRIRSNNVLLNIAVVGELIPKDKTLALVTKVMEYIS